MMFHSHFKRIIQQRSHRYCMYFHNAIALFFGQYHDERLTNKNIKAAQVLLVWETKEGSKETNVVSRQQALEAAKAANLDLVQGK